MTNRDEKIQEMLHAIAADAEQTGGMTGRRQFSPRVMEAMGKVPRDAFVPPDMQKQAFQNRPLPIGEGQTISQPYIVALMTDLLDPEPDDVMLEVGTGSGYQAAVLAELVERLYSIEVVEPLAQKAREVLESIGYHNIEVTLGDGYSGLPEHAPYDGIIVTAAAPHIPEPLKAQLKPGGKLVVPVGQPFSHQQLMVVEKDETGECRTREVLGVAFVPLTGEGKGQGSR